MKNLVSVDRDIFCYVTFKELLFTINNVYNVMKLKKFLKNPIFCFLKFVIFHNEIINCIKKIDKTSRLEKSENENVDL